MSRFSFGLFLILLLGIAGCGRSPFAEGCPEGFTLGINNDCVCLNNAACPEGLTCVGGTCRCMDDSCCPTGYRFASQDEALPDRCICAAADCCPEGSEFDEAGFACICRSDECCGEDQRFDPETETCFCAGDACCPEGFLYAEDSEKCRCASDGCCPLGYRYEDVTQGCTCANDGCCPEEHVYSEQVRACVCTGPGCCPEGFRPLGDGNCGCSADASCPPGLSCDIDSGRCLCTGPESCPSDSFCNDFGSCQLLMGCTTNLDCPDETFCFGDQRICLAVGTCAVDRHCNIGQICDEAAALCTPGCRTTGDCPLDSVCSNGQCDVNACDNNTHCELRSFCELPEQFCGDPDPNHCRSCDNGCGGDPCVTSIIEGIGSVGVCGVECVDGNDCPGGMRCSDAYFGCEPGNDICPSEGTVCVVTEILNEPPRGFCSDPTTRRPIPLRRYCSPRTGFCP